MESGRPKVLVVEDNDDLRDGLELLLRSEGYSVATAQDGEEALHKLRDDSDFAVVLLDVVMPGMDGPELRRELLKDPDLAAIPVVIMSATAEMEPTARALKAAGYMRKPIDTNRLRTVLRAIVRFGKRDARRSRRPDA
ncbi:MAG TPA: response regulator [Gammaproteobacteria bacterium]|nr:response regulator [Gammaproteobacteria bacterium]